MVENWVDFTLYVVAGAAALLCLFDGTRRIGAYGLHRKGVLMFVLAASACAFAGGFAYQKYTTLHAVVAANQRKPAAKPGAAAWTRIASPEKKELFSQMVARQRFKESGALGPFVDHNGEIKTFAPNLEDLAARERVVAYYSQTEFAARSSLAEALLWLISAVVAVVLGLAMSLDNKPPRPAQDQPPSDDTSPLH